MRAKRAHKQNMSTVTSTSFNKLVRVDWSFVVTSASSSSKSFGISKEGEGEEEGGDGDEIGSIVNLRLVFEDEEDDEEQQQQQKRKQREIKMELTLSQFYEFKRDLEIARKSLNDAEGEV